MYRSNGYLCPVVGLMVNDCAFAISWDRNKNVEGPLYLVFSAGLKAPWRLHYPDRADRGYRQGSLR